MSPRDLIVTGINLRATENGEVHFTDRYELVQEHETPILRRGLAFTVEVRFGNGTFDSNHHTVSFVFTYVRAPGENDRTKGVAIVGGNHRSGWKARAVRLENTSGIFKVESPSDTLVGEWIMNVSIKYQDSESDFHYPGPIYFIFNPWTARDSVHMPVTQLLDEYVVSDAGKIWTIANDELEGKHWIYGQYDKVVLPACLLMLKDSKINPTDFGDPVKVCQAIASTVNGKSGKGVLVGDCESPAEDPGVPCVHPEESGSVSILEQWMENENRPLKSGYSFVFAGLVTTACRALGIPARNVTNLGHGVDLNADSDVTGHVDDSHNSNRVTVLPFHVWNEVYMARPDLPQGFGGWQAIDGSPRFLPEGLYQYGPASVVAIKAGRRDLAHDVKVFITATNGDSQARGRNDQPPTLNRNTMAVGTGLYTKRPYTFDPNGEEDRENIMDTYKSPEGNEAEGVSEEGANGEDPDATRPTTQPKHIEVNMAQGMTVNFGRPLPITFKIKNNTNDEMTLRAVMVADTLHHNGSKGHNLKTEERTITMTPLQEQDLVFTIHPSECIEKMVGNGAVLSKLTVTSGPDVAASARGISRFRLPEIIIQRPEQLTDNQESIFSFSFRNPLNITLTECKIYYYSPDIGVMREKPFRDVLPYEEVTVDEYFTPTTTSLSMSMRFECKEIEFAPGRFEY